MSLTNVLLLSSVFYAQTFCTKFDHFDKACITTLCVARKTYCSCYYLKHTFKIHFPLHSDRSKLLFETETTCLQAVLCPKSMPVVLILSRAARAICCCVRMTKWRANVISVKIQLRGKLKDKMFIADFQWFQTLGSSL